MQVYCFTKRKLNNFIFSTFVSKREFVYNTTRKMGDYHNRKCIAGKERIKISCDPHEILRIVFQDYRTEYTSKLEQAADQRMQELVRHYDIHDNNKGFEVIMAVLHMMEGTQQDQGRQSFGCEIFHGMVTLEIGDTPVAFGMLKDEIDVAVDKAWDVYGRYQVPWLHYARAVLVRIDELRLRRM